MKRCSVCGTSEELDEVNEDDNLLLIDTVEQLRGVDAIKHGMAEVAK